MPEFKIPPISTLAGSTLGNFFRIIQSHYIEPKYYFKVFLTFLIIFIATPFHWWEFHVFNKKLGRYTFKKPPLFIIGHWRSGTTLLHNVLCKDSSFGYFTTYHSLFPNNLASKWIFKTFMRMNMPDKRPSDNVKLHIDFPQEDEFSFSNVQPNAYYNFFYFPKDYVSFYEKAMYHTGLSQGDRHKWYAAYDQLLKKAQINTNGERLIVKNPANTARIDKLLNLYPNARFLYIYRDPKTVFYSTQLFFQKLFPTLWLHEVDHKFIDKLIIDVYRRLMDDYMSQKSLIPKENLLEIRFEDFETNPDGELERIYTQLLNEDYSKVRSCFSEYFKTLKGYKKNKYDLDSEIVDILNKDWGKYMLLYSSGVQEKTEKEKASNAQSDNA